MATSSFIGRSLTVDPLTVPRSLPSSSRLRPPSVVLSPQKQTTFVSVAGWVVPAAVRTQKGVLQSSLVLKAALPHVRRCPAQALPRDPGHCLDGEVLGSEGRASLCLLWSLSHSGPTCCAGLLPGLQLACLTAHLLSSGHLIRHIPSMSACILHHTLTDDLGFRQPSPPQELPEPPRRS